jgi:hypothetical protein
MDRLGIKDRHAAQMGVWLREFVCAAHASCVHDIGGSDTALRLPRFDKIEVIVAAVRVDARGGDVRDVVRKNRGQPIGDERVGPVGAPPQRGCD